MGERFARSLGSPHVRFFLLLVVFGLGYYLYSAAIVANYGRLNNFPAHPIVKVGSLVAFVVLTQRIYRDRLFPSKES